jgi:hypothetical protein
MSLVLTSGRGANPGVARCRFRNGPPGCGSWMRFDMKKPRRKRDGVFEYWLRGQDLNL